MIINPADDVSNTAVRKYKEFYHGKKPKQVQNVKTPEWKEAIDGGELIDLSYIVEGKQAKGTPKAGKVPFRHKVKGAVGKGERPRILIHPSGKALQIVTPKKSKFKINDWYRN